MKFDDPNQEHIRFSLYVSDFGKLTAKPKILAGLVKWGKMTEQQARGYLTPGHIPEIRLVPADEISLQKFAEKFPRSVDINALNVERYESTGGKGAKSKFVTGDGAMVPRVGVEMLRAIIIGHLRVFSTDDEDRILSKALIRAEMFEREVYNGLDVPKGTDF